MHENERSLTEKGRATLAPLDPPMIVKAIDFTSPRTSSGQASWPYGSKRNDFEPF